MEFLLSSGSLYTYSLARCFEFAVAAGFDGMELLIDERWDTRQPHYLHRLMERYEMPVYVVHCPFRGVPGWSESMVELLQRTVAVAEAIGAGTVVHHLPWRLGYAIITAAGRRYVLPLPQNRIGREYVKWVEEEYPAYQAQTPVRLCIENMPARRTLGRRWNAHAWNTIEAMLRFANVTMDTTHLGTWGLAPLAVYERWGDRVRHVHLSNFNGREHRRPEDGQLALGPLLARLAADGYPGAVTLELNPHALDAGEEDAHILGLLRDSLALCREWAGDSQED